MGLLRYCHPLFENANVMKCETGQRFGEVVEATVDLLVAQCHRLYGAPPLGTLIRSGDGTPVYSIVSGIATSSLDPTRRAVARGAGAESEAEIHREHPQIERLLRTDVTLSVVGHVRDQEIYHYFGPLPPRVHTFVYICTPEEVRRFTRSLDFIASLTNRQNFSSDDVLAATLREAAGSYENPREFIVRAGRSLASLLGNDTIRLSGILRRLPL